MSLEDFTRELQNKPPLNRHPLDRWAYSDEDGCSFDREVLVTPLSWGIGIAFAAGLLIVAWASDGAEWAAIAAKAQQFCDFAIWLFAAG